MAHEPHEPYTIFNDTSTSWTGDLLVYINNVKEQNEIAKSNGNEYAIIKNVAVFFRTNNEVYRGYADIRSKNTYSRCKYVRVMARERSV